MAEGARGVARFTHGVPAADPTDALKCAPHPSLPRRVLDEGKAVALPWVARTMSVSVDTARA